jgi:heparanase 1
VFAFTFGNEMARASVAAGYPALRKLLDSLYAGRKAPMLAGPDLYAQHSFQYTLDEALDDEDKDIIAHLAGMSNFVEKAGSTLDAFSWHTYDYETPMLGLTDHQDLKMNPLVSRLWSTRHLDLALRLQGNVTEIARRAAPGVPVWISESNSVCHQGVNGVTNAFLNSIWLVNRLGIMANANVSVMARQSLVGYNYSLLGNWPTEPIQPNPDYFTTVLFKRLFGDVVLATTATPSSTGPPATNVTEGGDRARAFAFCASESMGVPLMRGKNGGAVSVAMVNFDPKERATFKFDQQLGSHQDYVLAPGGKPLVASAPWSSRQMLLNGKLLEMNAPTWELPAAITGQGETNSGGVVLPPLHVGFAVFPAAGAPDCM